MNDVPTPKVGDDLERVMAAATDAVTDDMVARLSENISEALGLIDRISASGVDRAIPVIAELVNTGDLERLVRLARTYGAAEDAVTDDMVGRLAESVGGGLELLDRVNRADVARALPALSRMVADGDLERLVNLARLVGSAEDAVTDDMVGRLAETVSGGLGLLDRVNSANLDKALPALARLVADGDLDRIANLARLVGSAEDAVTDDMVGRLAETVSGGLALLDRVNDANLEKALPALSRLVADGDLDRIANLARLIGAAEDAVTDDMVERLAEVIAEAISVTDRMHRSGLARLPEMLENFMHSGTFDMFNRGMPRLVEQMGLLEEMFGCFERASKEAQAAPPPSGGLMETLRMLRDPETQATLRFALALGRQMRDTCARRTNGA